MMQKKSLDWYLIKKHLSIKDAMKKIDECGEKILFVADSDNSLYGSLTDGDIRRWILSNGNLGEMVSEVCNKRPKYLPMDSSDEEIKDLMIAESVDCIPMVDGKRVIVDVRMLREVVGGVHQKVRHLIDIPLVIMAGGKGTRMAPFTRILPKSLVPIGDKPVIEIIIERFASHGVKEVYISVKHKANMIKAYFDEISSTYALHYIHEDDYYGTAGSLRMLYGKVRGPFFVSNCDIIVESDYSEIYDFHIANRNDITVVASMKHYRIPYGVCEIEAGGGLKGINEKPEFDMLVNAGLYIVNSEMISLIPQAEVFHITDLIENAKKNGSKVQVYPVSEKSWLDVGEWEEYKKALKQMGS